ncbi:GNAT family N-acetyltransferase [Flavitalea flava]
MAIRIDTVRLVLREFKKSDWERVHEYARDPMVLQYEAWGPNTEAETKRFLDVVIRNQQLDPRIIIELAIILRKENRLIGGCGMRIDPVNHAKGNFGYILNHAYWNQGFATEAATALINFSITDLGMKDFEATCDVLNIASQRVLEKVGLTQVKRMNGDFEMKGRIRDSFLYEKHIP